MSQVQCRLLQVIINQSEESIVCVDQSEQPIHCSLQCYQSLQHQTCSEQFYKESVKQELSNQEADTESKQRMVDILQRMNDDQDDEGVDSDDDEDPLDLADRLRGVNLDDAGETWAALTQEERNQFSELLRSGDVTSVLPDWRPWWSVKKKVVKIQELGVEEDNQEEYRKHCPQLINNIPSFSSICIKSSPCIKYGLLNVLYGYCYAVKYFHGDYSDTFQELVNIVQLLSHNLSGRNFDSGDSALETAASEVNHHQFLGISLKFSREVKRDVLEVVRGPSGADNHYILAALSDLISQFKKTLKQLKSDKKREESVKENSLPAWLSENTKPDLSCDLVKKHVKKLEFYLSWSNDNYSEFSEYYHD